MFVGALLPGLSRSKGFSQEQLERATGIGHSTMSGYWSGRLRLGDKNARKIAAALEVSISELGLVDPETPTDPLIAQAAALLREIRQTTASLIGSPVRQVARGEGTAAWVHT